MKKHTSRNTFLAGFAVALFAEYLFIHRLWLDSSIKNMVSHFKDADKLKIDTSGLVLDVGSGDQPHIRADLLCDKNEKVVERGFALLKDRPLVLGDIYHLPFKTKSIDFVISQHLMEHLENPEQAIQELERVGKAGLIRTPSPVLERQVTYPFHLWFVSNEAGTLTFREKTPKDFNRVTATALASNREFWRFVAHAVPIMTTELSWRDTIPYSVERINARPVRIGLWDDSPEEEQVSARRESTPTSKTQVQRQLQKFISRAFLKQVATMVTGYLYRQVWLKRPRNVPLTAILACPECKGDVIQEADVMKCPACRLAFPIRNKIPVMLLEEASAY